MEAVDNHLNRQQWVFLASKTVLRWATSPGEPHGRAARTAKANAEGTAPAAQFSHQPEVKERRR
ncbi:hypothetical protein [Dickeya zeae]|uniref:hypothetical protein n=1 Tax=Dickeya zeae TaxID=204042 RepID=UPI001C626001|nr:hypothetical protein [Dickeya zeae]